MNEAVTLVVALLGGGTLGVWFTAHYNHKSKQAELELTKETTKDEKAFKVLEGRIQHLEEDLVSLKVELQIKSDLVDQLKEENLLLKYENKELKEENAELKGEKADGTSN